MKTIHFSKEDIERFSHDPNVKDINQFRLRFTYEFRVQMYKAWIKNPSVSTVREFLKSQGYGDYHFKCEFICCLNKRLKKFGHPKNGNITKIRPSNSVPISSETNIYLISTGKFVKRNGGISFSDTFINELYDAYPEQSIEDGIRNAGIDPSVVGYQRIFLLKRRFDGTVQVPVATYYNAEQIDRYRSHPYVRRITAKQLTLTSAFYNEASVLSSMHINDILRIYEIEPDDLSVGKRNNLRYRLTHCERTKTDSVPFTEQTLRIQINRMKALENLLNEQLKQISVSNAADKKHLCKWIQHWPKDPTKQYSLQNVLKLVGMSRTTYYAILRNKQYGKAAADKAKQDKKDIKVIRKVIDHGGFGKGSRQIYMDMPDITGKHFGLKKIRRLMKKYGIVTEIRKASTSRQANQKLLKKNTKPNLLKRKFKLRKPNEAVLTDVTYIDYGDHKRAYGSAAKDPVTGRLVDFTVSDSNDLSLALHTADVLNDEQYNVGAIFHSDQGILYLSDTFQAKLASMGFRQSMSKRGNCWDNAPQESFFGHFKDEVDYEHCNTLEELQKLCSAYKDYYNNERRQWNLKQMTPVQYEAYLNSLSEKEYKEYLTIEQAKYDAMKKRAAVEAADRAKALGV